MKAKLCWAVVLIVVVISGGHLFKKIIFGDDFYTVDNIHDLFEIIGAAATTVALIVAAVSLGSWRKQAKAAIDHDIAKSLIISLTKFQDVTLSCWARAHRYMEWRQQNEMDSQAEYGFMVEYYESVLKDAKQSKVELESVVLEAEILWGDFLGVDLYTLYRIQDNCCRILEHAVMGAKYEGEGYAGDQLPSYVQDEWNKLVNAGVTDFRVAYSHIRETAKPLVGEARKKLLRS